VRERISSGSPYEEPIGFSRAIRVDDRVFVSGTAPIDAEAADPATQTRRCIEIISDALAQAGASLTDVVRTRVFITDRDDADAIGRVHGEFFGDVRPASTMVVVAGLLDPRWKVEIEADAVIDG
jgi:enamine deaminase RidA (YjgF/YER057c/UK114 family)